MLSLRKLSTNLKLKNKMKKLWKWLFGTRKQQCNIHGVSTSICHCGETGYDCDVFDMRHAYPKSEKQVLCSQHIKEKCEAGFFVAL